MGIASLCAEYAGKNRAEMGSRQEKSAKIVFMVFPLFMIGFPYHISRSIEEQCEVVVNVYFDLGHLFAVCGLRFASALRRGLENLSSSGRQKGRYLEFHKGMKTSLKKFSVNG
jgi:hypothetical protein